MADALATGMQDYKTTTFSLAGKAPWPQGVTMQRNIINGNGNLESEATAFNPGMKIQRIIDNLTTIEFSSVYAKEYVKQFDDSVNSYQSISEALEKGDSLLEVNNNDYGGMQELKQVARLIAARGDRSAERDFFFVGLGGFDNHANLEMNLANRFGTMNTGITAFVNEMKAQGIWENVVLATQSDFARTLDPNANIGTDHAWASNHFILSGGIKGGQVYNEFPASLAAGNPADLGRGRLIPKYPYESYMVPIAKWLGVESSQLNTVFPNLRHFNSSLIIPNLF